MSDGEEPDRVELDRAAWNLPTPPPEEVRFPPADYWPPWPFDMVRESVGRGATLRRSSREAVWPRPREPRR